MLQTLTKLDFSLSTRFRVAKNHPLWLPAVILAHSGDSWVWAIGLGILWLLTFQLPWLHRADAILETSVVVQALFVFALKRIIRRQRPNGDWGGIYRNMDPHSFPSGHATRAIMLAVLAAGLSLGWFAWLMVIWAPLVCISRVLTGVHYLSDILGGILLGLLMGLVFLAVSPLWIVWFPFLF